MLKNIKITLHCIKKCCKFDKLLLLRLNIIINIFYLIFSHKQYVCCDLSSLED
ncbi:hypothetical protein O3M35_012823 [Rhynocoris fuscipes]|uniref:Photosystem II protein I n=1 Tax=Rhynocoris fuscipes TaxID=488301 RepID=A0AAW1CHN8_9HEMI